MSSETENRPKSPNEQRWRLRHIGKVKNGVGFPVELQGDASNAIPFFKVKHLSLDGRDQRIESSEDTITEGIAQSLRATVFHEGTIVFAKIGAALLLGRFVMLGTKGCIDNNLAAFIVNKRLVDPDYLLYRLNRFDMQSMVQPGAVPSLSMQAFINQRVDLPDLLTQRQIADFLESETTRIDLLIEKKQRLVELLGEKRSAMITSAVTGGNDCRSAERGGRVSSLFQSIPDGWERTSLRRLADGPKNGAWGSEVGEDDIDAICVRVADFDWARLTLKLDDPTTRSFRKQQFRTLQLRFGDIVIEKSGGGEKTPVGRVVWFDKDVEAVTSNFVARIRPHEGVCSRFILYLLAAHYTSGYSYQFIKQNTGIQNLDDTNLFRSDVWVPDLPTQRQIADFLDRETARIDLLIEKKQRLVELLGEKKATAIDAIVNSDDWVGIKLSRLVRLIDGDRSSEYPSDEDFVEQGILFLSSKQIRGRVLTLEDAKFITPEKFARLGRGKLHDGDLIVTVRGTLGNTAVFTSGLSQTGFINAQIMIMRPEKGVDPYLLHSFTQSSVWADQIVINGYGSAQKQLNQDLLRRFTVRYPINSDPEIWKQMLATLNSKYAAVSEKTNASIDRLKEYRSALITAAVTGQMNVETHARTGSTDRHLDAIQEEMGE